MLEYTKLWDYFKRVTAWQKDWNKDKTMQKIKKNAEGSILSSWVILKYKASFRKKDKIFAEVS